MEWSSKEDLFRVVDHVAHRVKTQPIAKKLLENGERPSLGGSVDNRHFFDVDLVSESLWHPLVNLKSQLGCHIEPTPLEEVNNFRPLLLDSTLTVRSEFSGKLTISKTLCANTEVKFLFKST